MTMWLLNLEQAEWVEAEKDRKEIEVEEVMREIHIGQKTWSMVLNLLLTVLRESLLIKIDWLNRKIEKL